MTTADGPLAHLTGIIEHHDTSPAGRALAALLTRIDEHHVAGPHGNCDACVSGNTEWPCGEWLDSLSIAVSWVGDFLAVERADE